MREGSFRKRIDSFIYCLVFFRFPCSFWRFLLSIFAHTTSIFLTCFATDGNASPPPPLPCHTMLNWEDTILQRGEKNPFQANRVCRGRGGNLKNRSSFLWECICREVDHDNDFFCIPFKKTVNSPHWRCSDTMYSKLFWMSKLGVQWQFVCVFWIALLG